MIEYATIARPYAKALFELSQKNKAQSQDWLNGLAELAWLVQQPKVASIIDGVQVDSAEKANALLHLLGDAPATQSTEFRNFVSIVAEEKRFDVLPEIYNQYQTLLLDSESTKQAVIYTAFDVDEEQKARIISDLEQRFKVHLLATFQTQSELIGGVKVEVGDQVLDLSVQGKLKQLYTTMTN